VKPLLFLLSAVACLGAGVNMPTARTCLSPDSHWRLRCETSAEGASVIHLSRMGAKRESPIWNSTRNCDMLWSADSTRLAITDWTGSTDSEIAIVDPATAKVHPLDVSDIKELIPPHDLGGHCYYEALSWDTSHRLYIRVFGHPDQKPLHGFTYFFIVDIASGEAQLLLKEDEEGFDDDGLARLTVELREAMTQTDMNIASGELAKYWDRRLAAIEKRIEAKLDIGEKLTFAKSKARWAEHRSKDVALAAGFYEGGSMQPLVANNHFAHMTENRVHELEGILPDIFREDASTDQKHSTKPQ
jgi:uncharacterized protein YecT (DUF1311 family)